MIYTVTLNPALDYVVALPGELTPGGINRVCREEIQYGGKGINVSNVLNTLGVENLALGFVAGFTGMELARGLGRMGIAAKLFQVEGMTRINVKVKAGAETEINGIGPHITEADFQKLLEMLDELRPGDTLVLSGSIPGCLPPDTYARLLAQVEGRGIRTVVDASKKLLLESLRYRPFLVKPNHHELGEIFGKTLNTPEEIGFYAKKLQEMGAQNVLVSMAGDGALLLDEFGKLHRMGCPTGTVVNSVGAGDSMVAGFLAGFLQTGDYAHALKLGTAAGSATAFSPALADRETIEALLARLPE